jgi:hypothetical protein
MPSPTGLSSFITPENTMRMWIAGTIGAFFGVLNVYLIVNGYGAYVAMIDFAFNMLTNLCTKWPDRIGAKK